MQTQLTAILKEGFEKFRKMTYRQNDLIDIYCLHWRNSTSRIGMSPIGINGLGKIFV